MTTRAYLVTGVSGSGKSTICQQLASRGHRAFDIDDGFARWIHRESGDVAEYRDDGLMAHEHDWMVDEPKVREAINSSGEPVWFCGSAHNLHLLSDLFTHMFVLEYPSEQVIRERIMNRTNSDYGKAPGELEEIIGYQQEYEARFTSRGATTIDCTLSVDEIVKKLESVE